MEEPKKPQELSSDQRRDQLITELLLRISALERVLIDTQMVKKEDLMEAIKTSLKQLVTVMTDNGMIKDAEVVLTSIDKNIN